MENKDYIKVIIWFSWTMENKDYIKVIIASNSSPKLSPIKTYI